MLWFTAGCSGEFCDYDDITHISSHSSTGTVGLISTTVPPAKTAIRQKFLEQTYTYFKATYSLYLKFSRLMQGLPGLLACRVTCNEWVTPAF